MRTITQAAEELSVSRKKIYNEIERLNISTKKEGKNNYITDDDFNNIRQQIEDENQSTQERTRNVLERDRSMIGGSLSDREYVDLKERIEFLEQQIKAKDFQLNGLIQISYNLSKPKELPAPDEVAVTQTEEKIKKASWIKKIFKR